MKLEVSNRHITLRIVVTAVAFVVAVIAFTIGVVSIGHKDPGYHAIEAKVDAEALLYNNAVTLKYWFDGSTNEIKRGINALTEVYTPILSASYKQLDPHNLYTGMNGIATLNLNQGRELVVSEHLYAVLKDAYRRTLEDRGYNMFAGDLYAEWKGILILDEPEAFDPALNSAQASRIAEVAAVVSDLSNFRLEFLNDSTCTVRFSVSDAYRQFCTAYEIDSMPLDLNLLHDAYLMDWIATDLLAEGYDTGYLFTSEAQVLCLGSRGTLGYSMYTMESGRETVYASLDLEGPFSATTFTAFGMGSYYGYTLDTDSGRPLYRHMYFDVRTGTYTDVLLSATIIGNDRDIIGTVYQSIILNTLPTEQETSSYASTLDREGYLVSYVFQSTPGIARD